MTRPTCRLVATLVAVAVVGAGCTATDGPPEAVATSPAPDAGASAPSHPSPSPLTSAAAASPQDVILTLDDLGKGWVEVDQAADDDPALESTLDETCGADIDEVKATLTAPGHAFAAFERPERGWTIKVHVVRGEYDESLTAYHRDLGACGQVETESGGRQVLRGFDGGDDPGEDPYVGAEIEVYVPYGSERPQHFSPKGRLAGTGDDVLMHAGCCWIRMLHSSIAPGEEIPTTFRWFPVLSEMAERAHGIE